MNNRIEEHTRKPSATIRGDRLLCRLLRENHGAAALEFALLAIPFFLIVFALIETVLAFMGEQLLTSAADTMARKIRTGEITFSDSTAATYKSEEQFRQAFCDEIAIMLSCSATEAKTPSKLFLDVR